MTAAQALIYGIILSWVPSIVLLAWPQRLAQPLLN